MSPGSLPRLLTSCGIETTPLRFDSLRLRGHRLMYPRLVFGHRLFRDAPLTKSVLMGHLLVRSLSPTHRAGDSLVSSIGDRPGLVIFRLGGVVFNPLSAL